MDKAAAADAKWAAYLTSTGLVKVWDARWSIWVWVPK